jgi:fumarate reductase flavoprotein subunit
LTPPEFRPTLRVEQSLACTGGSVTSHRPEGPDRPAAGPTGILPAGAARFSLSVPVLIVGAGACGCVAALAARERGAVVMLLERDAVPRGSTALSGGQIPAAGSGVQRAAGIDDAPDLLAADLIRKARGQNDAGMARRVAGESARTVDWLIDTHGVSLAVVRDFLYPGHSRHRMHATPGRHGLELIVALLGAVGRAGIDLATSALVTDLFADETGRVHGVRVARPDGSTDDVGCRALVLACNGFGGNPAMLRRYIPEMAEAHYHGHEGNTGDAVRWGLALGAAVADMGSFQGHGAVTTPHHIHLGWPTITQGGFQVDVQGERFSDENTGYSEQALHVIQQPGSVAWTIFDERCHRIALQMHSHRLALEAGAIHTAATVQDAARLTGCPADALARTVRAVEAMARGERRDPFGRDFTGHPPLEPPYRIARVTGALFHTQGGLVIDARARVLRPDGTPLPNLFAGGGAARGLSGPADWGYLSGSGLLTATSLGRLAGEAAAALIRQDPAARA